MRLLSLLPAATDIVTALGCAPALVGVTHACDAEAAVPRVTASAVDAAAEAGVVDAAVRELSDGGRPLFVLDERRIAALAPDVVLTQRLCDVCAVSERDVRALAGRLVPSPRVVTLAGATLDGIWDDVAAVAGTLGAAERGRAMVEEARGRLRRVHETLKAARAPRPRVAVVEWTDPVFLAGHWGPDLVRRAGGVDVLGTVGAHSTTVALEALAAADPEVVLVAPCGYDLAHAAAEGCALLADARWAWLGGRAVWALDANAFLSRPGPRLVDGVELFARLLHPALFGAPDAASAVRLA